MITHSHDHCSYHFRLFHRHIWQSIFNYTDYDITNSGIAAIRTTQDSYAHKLAGSCVISYIQSVCG